MFSSNIVEKYLAYLMVQKRMAQKAIFPFMAINLNLAEKVNRTFCHKLTCSLLKSPTLTLFQL